jgi:DNA-directed RNA polymerase specialized sigma subunit
MQKKVWIGNEKQLAKAEAEYRMEAGKLRIEMVEILREKARVDAFLQELTLDEAMFVEMRFEKGYGFDYIAMKMHLSRATVFRIQDRVLEKMGIWRKNEML